MANFDAKRVADLANEIESLSNNLERKRIALMRLMGAPVTSTRVKGTRKFKGAINYKTKHGEKSPALLLGIIEDTRVPMTFQDIVDAAQKKYNLPKGTVSSGLFYLTRNK